MLKKSKAVRRALAAVVWSSTVLLLAACGSDATEQAQTVAPTAIPTTAPISLPTATPVPTPAPVIALPQVAPTSQPTPAPAPTSAPTAAPAPTPDPEPAAATASEEVAAATPVPTATAEPTAEPTEIPAPTATVPPEESPTAVAETPTPEDEPTVTPTVVVASGEPPLECYDRDVNVYRGFVDGVDDLSFENGRVFCAGAGTNGVSVNASYRHSTGLIIQRNGDFIFNDAGTAYIPYSGFVHFCLGAEAVSVPIRADSVPALLVVIDSEAQRQISLGASRPAGFTSSGTQC